MVLVLGGTTSSCEASDTATSDLVQRLTANGIVSERSTESGRSIRILAGTHHASEPVRLTQVDSGIPSEPLVISGAMDGSSHLVGSTAVSAVAVTGAEATEINGKSLGKLGILKLDLHGSRAAKDGLTRRGAYVDAERSSFELYQGSVRLTPARWPKRDFSISIKSMGGEQGARGPKVAVPSELFARWRNERHLWFAGYWTSDWAYESTLMTGIDADAKALEFLGLKSQGKIRDNFRFFVENAFSELTDPGEYVLDSDRSAAFVIPIANGGDLQMINANAIVEIDGAHDIILENLSFEKSLGTVIKIKASENITIRNCFVGHSGAGGIRIEDSRNVTIENCVIRDTAETAVYMSGGNRKSLEPSGNRIMNSVITDFGVRSRTYRPGVQLAGVGNRVEGCLIARASHSGVIVAGNDNVILGNEFAEVAKEAYDSGAIYMGRDWTERGNVIEGNFFHEIGNKEPADRFISGVYLDYQASGYLIRRNVFLNVWRGVVIQGGRDNVIDNNAFILMPASGVWLHKLGEGLTGGVLEKRLRSMPIQESPWAERYPSLRSIADHDPASPLNNVLTGNTAIGTKLIEFLTPADRAFVPLERNMNRESIASSKHDVEDPAQFAAALMVRAGSDLPVANRNQALSRLLYRGYQ